MGDPWLTMLVFNQNPARAHPTMGNTKPGVGRTIDKSLEVGRGHASCCIREVGGVAWV